MAFALTGIICLFIFWERVYSETVFTPTKSAAILSDPSHGSGIVYASEGSDTYLLWRYYVPQVTELSEISIAHNEHHAVRFFRIRSSSLQVTNITAVYPPFPTEAFVNDLENMTVGLHFPNTNLSFVAGNWTLSIVYSNIATPAATSTVILYVAAAPVNVKVEPSYRYPLIRSKLEIKCTATSSGLTSLASYGKPVYFRWFHNGMTLSPDLVPAPELLDGQTWLSRLVIANVGEAHAGGYACQAEELGMAAISPTIRITVVGFPSLVQKPFPALAGDSLMLSCHPHLPTGLGVECSSLNVRLTCNGRQLHSLTFPTLLPLYNSLRLRRADDGLSYGSAATAASGTNDSTLASVDYTFETVTPELNTADCLCIVKYNRRKMKAVSKAVDIVSIKKKNETLLARSSELLSSIRLVVLFPPNNVKLIADPPLPWLVPSSEGQINVNGSAVSPHFRLKCSVGTIGNPKDLRFSWPSEQLSPSSRQLSLPNAWTSVLDLTNSLQPVIDNSRSVQCFASNDAGNSRPAYLNLVMYGSPVVSILILPSGQVIEPGRKVEVQDGAAFTIRCVASVSGATPQPQRYIWRRDGIPLSSSSRDLVIPSIQPLHAGMYVCEAVIDTQTSTIGVLTASMEFDLLVQYINLTITAKQPSEVVGEGDNITLVCSAQGYPNAGIKFGDWLFEPLVSSTGGSVPAARSISGAVRKGRFGKFREFVINLANVQPSDSGKYWCSATNQASISRRRFHFVNVHFKPRLNTALSSPTITPIRVGQPVVLLAAISANPNPEQFTWVRLSGKLQTPGPIPPSWIAENISPIASQLHIPSLSPADLYDGPVGIAIRVRNQKGQSMFRFTLVARGPPSNPTALRVVRSWPNSLHLTFQPGFDGGQPQLFQVICIPAGLVKTKKNKKTEAKAQNVVVRDPGYGRAARVIVQNLHPSTSYRCSVEGIASRMENDSTVPLASAKQWRTSKIFVNAKTLAVPFINFTNVDWVLASKFNANASSGTSRKRRLYLLERLCISVSCTSHPQECNSSSEGQMLVSSGGTSVTTNLAGMRFAVELSMCSHQKTNRAQLDPQCWMSSTNHTIKVDEHLKRNALENETTLIEFKEENSKLCFGPKLAFYPSNSSSIIDILPVVDYAVLVSIRLYSIMDGDLVTSLSNAAFTPPHLLRTNGRFYLGVADDYLDEFGSEEAASTVADGMLMPILSAIIGVVLVIGFIGMVALVACTAARKANKRIRRRTSLSTNVSSDGARPVTGVFAVSTSPSSSSGNGSSKVTNEQGKSKDRLTNAMTLSYTSSYGANNALNANDAAQRRRLAASAGDAGDFHWADFRANPLLASVGVATANIANITTTGTNNPYGGHSLRTRKEERVITCVNGINNSHLFGETGQQCPVEIESPRRLASRHGMLARAEIEDVPMASSSSSNDDTGNEIRCVDGFELQQKRRHSALSDSNLGVLKQLKNADDDDDETVSPPPRYTTLYSRLADLKPPREHPIVLSNYMTSAAPTQYARLDFLKMARLSSDSSKSHQNMNKNRKSRDKGGRNSIALAVRDGERLFDITSSKH